MILGGHNMRRAAARAVAGGLIPQDYTTFTKQDPNNRYTVASNSVSSTLLTRNEDALLHKDFGAGYFDGDFTHEFDSVASAGSDYGLEYPWALTNIVDDATGWGDYLWLWNRNQPGGTYAISLVGKTGGVAATRTGIVANVARGQRLYATIIGDSSAGAFGTVTALIYSDATRETLHGSYVLTLQAAHPWFRYLYAIASHNSGSAQQITGDSRNLAIG